MITQEQFQLREAEQAMSNNALERFFSDLQEQRQKRIDRFANRSVKALEIAERYIKHPPGKGDWENGAFLDEVRTVMKFVADMREVITTAKAAHDARKA